ncbi:hypothetical protein CR513_55875, partial [Mucuna pruriens]
MSSLDMRYHDGTNSIEIRERRRRHGDTWVGLKRELRSSQSDLEERERRPARRELGCSDHPEVVSDPCCSSHLSIRSRRVSQEETKKLLTAGFIREIQYPMWLANVVMVKKANEKWHICTDYTNLNKACPKDPYPLPNIDRLVDGAFSFAFLSFMDAYSGYN